MLQSMSIRIYDIMGEHILDVLEGVATGFVRALYMYIGERRTR